MLSGCFASQRSINPEKNNNFSFKGKEPHETLDQYLDNVQHTAHGMRWQLYHVCSTIQYKSRPFCGTAPTNSDASKGGDRLAPERKAAWERLTPEQRKEVQERFRAIVAQAKQTAEKEKGKSKEARKTWQDIITGKQSSTEADLTLAFTDEQGNRRLLKAKEREANTTLSATPSSQARLERKDNHLTRRQSQALWSNAFGFAALKRASFVKASATAMAQSGDADMDGLPEDFENAVADAFTPFYHVSTGEPDGFAIFGNFVPQTVQQVFSPIPPISHFRVQPLGFAYNSYGQLVSVLRIDYLTLWNHDSGLVSGALCAYNLFGIDDIVAALSDHNLDEERRSP
jgi:predicted Fe-S protein YdhL (DUF1289 family)